MVEDWMADITTEDVPEQYHDMIGVLGLRSFLELMQTHGGTYFYIPKADIVLRKIRDDKIRAAFNGGNYKDLAIKYSLTEITIRRIVEGEKDRQLPGQVSMLDEIAAT